MDTGPDISRRYLDFAAYSEDESPCFGEWARGVAGDREIHAWLADLPVPKQQPNLVFAAARWHGAATPSSYAELRRVLLGEETAVKATVLARATQTNEAGRLATLAPVLGLLDGPLALLEVGASAGLCLYPDRYDYRWSAGELRGSGGPTLSATSTGALPVPDAHARVAWRAGVDLHPLDVCSRDDMAWLDCLIWPGQEDRRALLRDAVEVARREPPDVRRGDLLEALPSLVEEASAHGTPVVFHTAVIAYLPDEDRERFHDLMTALVEAGRCHWISNEAPGVLPRITRDLRPPVGHFVLALDGVPRAFAHQHGRSVVWL